MEQINRKIKQIEGWLREHPNGDWEARHDKIVELAELKEKLNLKNTQTQIQDGHK